MASQKISYVWLDFKSKKELQVYLVYQSNQCKMNTSAKFSNISTREKAKFMV